MIINKMMLTTMLVISITQQTCEPTYYQSPDGQKHMFERTPSESAENLYCIVHDQIESVYRLTPDIQDVEGGNDIVHQVYQKLDDIDKETMKFATKLGDFEESGYVVKIDVVNNGEFEEVVYFVVPKDKE